MRPYSPGGILNALAAVLKGLTLRAPSIHRLRRGLPGYLILFAPHAFAPQRQYSARQAPSPQMFLLISTNFTSTPGIPPPSQIFKTGSFDCYSKVKLWAFTIDFPTRLRALYAQLFRTTLAPSVLPRLLARSQPVLLLLVPSRLSNIFTKPLLPSRKSFTTQGPSSLTRRCCIRLAPIVQNSHCCLP